MNNKELAGLLLTAAEICDEALEIGIGDDLRAEAAELETKLAELQTKLAAVEAVSVPDEVTFHDCPHNYIGGGDTIWAIGWNACREAILAAAPQPEES